MIRQAIVLGTGGHSRVILSLLAAVRTHEILEIIELGVARESDSIMGKPITPFYNHITKYCKQGGIDFFLAIGDVRVRKSWWERLTKLGMSMPNLISPYAIIDETAELGQGNVICARSFLGPFTKIGNNNLINTGVIVEHEVNLGNHCHLAPASLVAGRSQISDLCFVGAGSTIIDKVMVAMGTIVGAGATVITNIDQVNTVVVGVPAKFKKDTH